MVSTREWSRILSLILVLFRRAGVECRVCPVSIVNSAKSGFCGAVQDQVELDISSQQSVYDGSTTIVALLCNLDLSLAGVKLLMNMFSLDSSLLVCLGRHSDPAVLGHRKYFSLWLRWIHPAMLSWRMSRAELFDMPVMFNSMWSSIFVFWSRTTHFAPFLIAREHEGVHVPSDQAFAHDSVASWFS